jgi:predicted O-methyltransferase YrrM
MLDHRTPLTETLCQYILARGVREAPLLKALGEETARLPNAGWATTPEQGAFLQVLVHLIRARRIIEVGTFTGYGTLALALALPEDGKIVTCDIAEGWSEMGTHYWREAGVEKRIERRHGRAEVILTELCDAGGRSGYDMIFLDADKAGYARYLELAADLLRSGGVLMADNVFRGGTVVEEGAENDQLAGLRAFNDRLRDDERFWISMLSIADGMTLAVKK